MSDTISFDGAISQTQYADENFEKPKLNSEEVCESTKKMAVKFLLSNIAAGVIIGRSGSNITELQQHSGARIQLSRSNDFYPGTNDRVMLISGTVRSVLAALYRILLKLSTAKKLDGNGEAIKNAQSRDLASNLKIVMPAVCCGAIIGKGGETIRNFVDDSGATISILPKDCVSQKMNHRIISISGEVDQMLRAVALVVTKVAGDSKYINNISLSVNYSSILNEQDSNEEDNEYLSSSQCPQSPSIYATSFTNSPTTQHNCPPFHPSLPPSVLPPHPSVRTEISISIPDERIGAIIGKGGEIIMQLQTLVGVKIIISARDKFEPGTRNRRVTIVGSPEAVQIAHMLISMKERAIYPPHAAIYSGAAAAAAAAATTATVTVPTHMYPIVHMATYPMMWPKVATNTHPNESYYQ